jgi:hypothetical protein
MNRLHEKLRETKPVSGNGNAPLARKHFNPTRIFVEKDRLAWFWFLFAMAIVVAAAVDRFYLVQNFKQRERVVVIDPAGTFYVSPVLKFQEAKDLHAQQSTLATLAFFGIAFMAICSVSVVARRTASAASSFLGVVIINPLKSMSTKTPECWASDPNARAVKIELSAEQSLLLPFDQFAFSELKSEGKQQQLHLVFATHEVLLRGHSLRRIETAMQRMELSLLTALPGKQRSLVPDGQPVILEIIATETEAKAQKAVAE